MKKTMIYKIDSRFLLTTLITMKTIYSLFTHINFSQLFGEACKKRMATYTDVDINLQDLKLEDIDTLIKKVASATYDKNQERYYLNICLYFVILKSFYWIYIQNNECPKEIKSVCNINLNDIKKIVLNNLREHNHLSDNESQKINKLLNEKSFKNYVLKENLNLNWFMENCCSATNKKIENITK